MPYSTSYLSDAPFKYRHYFQETYIPPDFPVLTHSISGTSLFPGAFGPFFLLGVLILVYKGYKRDSLALLLISSFLIGTVPPSLTMRAFDSYRSVALLPLMVITIALGVNAILKVVRFLSYSGYVVLLVFLLIGAGSIVKQEIKTLFDYEYQTEAAYETGWHYGYRQVFSYFVDHYAEYEGFVVTETVAYVPRTYIRFFDYESRYNKIRVGDTDTEVDGSKVLYALRPDEIDPSQLSVKKIVYYPNGLEIAFYIGELKNKAQ